MQISKMEHTLSDKSAGSDARENSAFQRWRGLSRIGRRADSEVRAPASRGPWSVVPLSVVSQPLNPP